MSHAVTEFVLSREEMIAIRSHAALLSVQSKLSGVDPDMDECIGRALIAYLKISAWMTTATRQSGAWSAAFEGSKLECSFDLGDPAGPYVAKLLVPLKH